MGFKVGDKVRIVANFRELIIFQSTITKVRYLL